MKRVLLVISFPLLGMLSCLIQGNSTPFEQTRFLMDTVVQISIYPQGMSEKEMNRIMDKVFAMMEEMEVKMSSHIDTSDVNQINTEAGQSSVQVSSDVIQLLKTSTRLSEMCEGALDITVGAIDNLWHFNSDFPIVPDQSIVSSILPLVDYQQIRIDDRDHSVMLNLKGMQIDLGSIAKGYIIDRGIEILQENGVCSGIIDAGGDLRIVGFHPERKTWRIGIRDPRGENGELYGIIETAAVSIATSGDYERYFIQDGIVYHHIFDPRTGFPARGCISVTIVAEEAVIADGYATAVFVLGPEEGMALIEHIPEIEGLILYEEEGTIQSVVSDGLLDKIQYQ